MDNLQFLYLPNSSPNEVEIVIRNNHTGKILGHVFAKAEENKGYGGKIPKGYIDYEKSGEYVKAIKSHMYVEDLFVKEGVRHEGLGRKLIGKIAQESMNRGFSGRIMLLAGNTKDVSPLPFYWKLGFVSGDKLKNKQIENAIATNTTMNNLTQAFMGISTKGIKAVLKAIR